MISVGARVIDLDYRGSIKVLLFNHANQPFTISKGDRIAQLIIECIHNPIAVEVLELTKTARNNQGFGSTDNTRVRAITTIENHEEQIQTIVLHHDTPLTGHPGIAKTLELLTYNFYWLTIRKDVETYVRGCVPCQMNKTHQNKPHAHLNPVNPGKTPFKHIFLHLLSPLP